MITILSGPVQTGKSTMLKNLAEKTVNVGGFICTEVDGLRHLINAYDKTIHTFEIRNETNQDSIKVGRFTFALSAFENAGVWTMEHLKNENIDTIIIDEMGKLEMNDQGFHDLFVNVLNYISDKRIIVVVRDFLLDDFIQKYALKEVEIKATIESL